MAFCSNCGTKIPEGVKFCPECGTRVIAVAEPAPVVVEEPVPVAAEEPVPAPVVDEPAPVVEESVPVAEEPVPVAEEPAPVVAEEPASVVAEEPAPAVEEPEPVVQEPVIEAEPVPAVQQPAGPVKFEVGEDGLEYVPYVPVENPQPLGGPAKAAAPVDMEAVQAVPAAAPAPKKAAKAPKKGIAKFLPFIIIGGVALVAIFIGLIVLVVSLIGGLGGAQEADDVLGVYHAATAEMMGYEVAVDDIWEGEVSVELQKKGKCVVTLDDNENKGKWTLEDGALTVSGGGLNCEGTLEDGIMTLENVMGMDVTLTLAKEGAYLEPGMEDPDVGIEDPGVPADDGPMTEMQEKWNGTWYGVVNFMQGTGKYAPQDYMQYDAYMQVELDSDDTGMIKLWMDPELPPFAVAHVEAAEYGLRATDGQVLSTHMNAENWMFVPAPDSETRYVMPYDSVEDHDGDTFEYVVFMKKWGDSWAEELENYEVTPPYVEAYEEYISNGEAAPALDMDAALGENMGQVIPGGPVNTVTEIAVPSNWYGWVSFSNWWGNDEADSLIDAWGSAGIDVNYNGGTPYYEVFVDNVDTAFYSVYMTLEEGNTVVRPIADGYAWVGDVYLEAGDEDKYVLRLMDDGTLCAEFEFVGANGEYGCDVMMCFREHGQLWNVYEDRLPPRYDEYLEQLEHESALEVLETAPEGDGIVSFDVLNEGFKVLYDSDFGISYEEVRAMFGGVEGAPGTWESDFHAYRWQTSDGEHSVAVSFNVDEAGLETYSGISWSGDVGE